MSLFPVLNWPWPMSKTQGHHDFSIQNINELKYVSSPCVYYVSWFHFLRGRICENLPQGPSYQFICPHLGGECGCDQCGWSTLRETAAGVGVSLSMYIHHLSVHIFWMLLISCYVHDVVIWNFGAYFFGELSTSWRFWGHNFVDLKLINNNGCDLH